MPVGRGRLPILLSLKMASVLWDNEQMRPSTTDTALTQRFVVVAKSCVLRRRNEHWSITKWHLLVAFKGSSHFLSSRPTSCGSFRGCMLWPARPATIIDCRVRKWMQISTLLIHLNPPSAEVPALACQQNLNSINLDGSTNNKIMPNHAVHLKSGQAMVSNLKPLDS